MRVTTIAALVCLAACNDTAGPREHGPSPVALSQTTPTPARPLATTPSSTPTSAPPRGPAPSSTAPASARIHTAFARSTPEERRAVGSFLRRGRAAARAGDRAGALALFRQGLALERDDPRLLCEAGWMALQLGDPSAEEYLRTGASLMSTPSTRAACLYNLGRLYEREADATTDDAERARSQRAAGNAYAESLALRPDNAETRRRFDALPAAARDPAFCPPRGSFAGERALCDAFAAWAPDAGDPSCERGGEPIPTEGEGPPLDVYRLGDDAWSTLVLVAHVRGALAPLAVLGNAWDRSCSWGAVSVTAARWTGSEAQRLEVIVHESGEYSCEPSGLDSCLDEAAQRGEGEEACDDVADDEGLDITDETHRLFCVANADGDYRCSILADSRAEHRPWAELGPLPEGDALERALECPAR